MIFVTVGTDLPFNRLINAVDQWAKKTGRTDVFAQIGDTDWQPSHIKFSKFLEPPEFTHMFSSATAVIAHAGMGTILSALHYGKPILVMPRQARLGEQRNDHQLATARRLAEMNKVHVAFDEKQLDQQLRELAELKPRARIGAFASEGLLAAITGFIHQIPNSPLKVPTPQARLHNSPMHAPQSNAAR
ncbi:MAG TPA: glycosyltransferase [Verrucomicrobiae bacterium]|nr:glycosyltransferase [Verrucomicrobiae bacterium]